MEYQLVVRMRDGSSRTFRGREEELDDLRGLLLRAVKARSKTMVTYSLSTEGVMILASQIVTVGEPLPVEQVEIERLTAAMADILESLSTAVRDVNREAARHYLQAYEVVSGELEELTPGGRSPDEPEIVEKAWSLLEEGA